MGIFFAVVSSVLQAVAFTVLKKSYETFPTSVMFFFLTIFGALIWIPYALIVGFNTDLLGLVLLYALISTIMGQAFPSWTLTKGELGITGSIFATYPMYTVLFSLGINHETLTLVQWLFILTTFLGTIVVSLPAKLNKKELLKSSLVLWPVAAAVSIGFSDSLSKKIITQAGVEAFLFALAISQFPIAIAFLRIEHQSMRQFTRIIRHLRTYQWSILASFLLVLVLLTLFLAFSYAPASIAAPIAGSYPALLVILAAIVFKEKITLKKLLGILLVMAGAIGLGYYSG